METMDILDKLYDLLQEQMQCGVKDKEIISAKNKLKNLLEDADNEGAILDYGIAYEKNGFHYGFVLAVHIMAQCIHETPKSIF